MDSTTETSSASSDESVHPKKEFVCAYKDCKASFSKNRKLLNHIRRHTGQRPFACNEPNCSKAYTSSSHLRRHKKVFHAEGDQKICCTYENCNLLLANKTNLKKHISRMHKPDRKYPFNCRDCGQGFLRKRLLQKHSFIHTGVVPFKCDVCNDRFMTLYDCNRHKRNHAGYTCECTRVFERWSELRAHKTNCKKHSYECQKCNKSFKTNLLLIHHSAIHKDPNEKKLFICEYENCARYYMYKKNLDQHIRTFHKNIIKKVVCPVEGCGKLLCKNQNLKVHMKLHSNTRKVNKPRKPRKDKGIPKKSAIASILGIELPKDINQSNGDVVNSNLESDIQITNITIEESTSMKDIRIPTLKELSWRNIKEESMKIINENVNLASNDLICMAPPNEEAINITFSIVDASGVNAQTNLNGNAFIENVK